MKAICIAQSKHDSKSSASLSFSWSWERAQLVYQSLSGAEEEGELETELCWSCHRTGVTGSVLEG